MKMNSSEHFSSTLRETAASWFRDYECLNAITDFPVWLQNSSIHLNVDPHLYLNTQPEYPSAETVDVTLTTGPTAPSQPTIAAPRFSDPRDLTLNGANTGTFPAGQLVSSLVSPVDSSETRALSPVDAGSYCGGQSWPYTPLQPCLPGIACHLCIPFGEEVELHSSPYVPEVASPRLLRAQEANETRLCTGSPSTGTEHLQAEFVLDTWRASQEEDFPCLVCGRRCDSVGALQNHLMLSWKRNGDCNVLYKSLYSSAHPHVELTPREVRSQSPQPGPSKPCWGGEARPRPSRKRAREAEEDSDVIVPGQKRARKTKHLETGSDQGSKNKNRKKKKSKRRREERSPSC